MKPAPAFPLTWPERMPRAATREKGAFRTTLHQALNDVDGSLRAFSRDSGKAVGGIVLSSNVALGIDTPADPGVAVWFSWDGLQICIPVDRYTTPAANLQAIHHVLEARRTELRHGTLELIRASFEGLRALSAPSRPPWWEVLEIAADATPAAIEAAHKHLARARHPDHGGSADAMAELNLARDAGLRAVSGKAGGRG